MEFKSNVRHKVLSAQAREIVSSVAKYMKSEAERGAPGSPWVRVQQRVSNATGVSIRTIRRIIRESEDIDNGKQMTFQSPNKTRTPRKPKTSLSDCEKDALRRIIYGLYNSDKQTPTIAQITTKFREETGFSGSKESMRRIMHDLGFRWQKSKSHKPVLIEKQQTVNLDSFKEKCSHTKQGNGVWPD